MMVASGFDAAFNEWLTDGITSTLLLVVASLVLLAITLRLVR